MEIVEKNDLKVYPTSFSIERCKVCVSVHLYSLGFGACIWENSALTTLLAAKSGWPPNSTSALQEARMSTIKEVTCDATSIIAPRVIKCKLNAFLPPSAPSLTSRSLGTLKGRKYCWWCLNLMINTLSRRREFSSSGQFPHWLDGIISDGLGDARKLRLFSGSS